MNQKALNEVKKVRELRTTIDPDSGKPYTFERIGEIRGYSGNHAQYLANPNHNLRRRARARMTRVVVERFTTIASEDWSSAYALLNRLKTILKEASNV